MSSMDGAKSAEDSIGVNTVLRGVGRRIGDGSRERPGPFSMRRKSRRSRLAVAASAITNSSSPDLSTLSSNAASAVVSGSLVRHEHRRAGELGASTIPPFAPSPATPPNLAPASMHGVDTPKLI